MNPSDQSPFGDPSTQVGQTLLGTLSAKSSAPLRAMARNLLSDHRIPEERATEFLKLAGSTTTMDEIREALRQYQKDSVRPDRASRNAPVYEHLSNTSNLVELPSGGELCTVLNLTRWASYYVEANKTFRMPEFRSFEFDNLRHYEQVNARLSERLNDPGRAETFLTAVFQVRNRYLASIERKRHPTWAADWNTLLPFLTPKESRHWLQAVGVSFPDAAWLAVVKYPVENKRRKIRLYRPTQLDAGWYVEHFPSPPQTPLLSGGHCMFLSAPPPPLAPAKDRLVSEYIHQEPDFYIGDWIEGGRRLGFAQPVKGDLAQQRSDHWVLLQSKYVPGPIREWMPESC